MNKKVYIFALAIAGLISQEMTAQAQQDLQATTRRFIKTRDKDGDGKLSKSEFPQAGAALFSRIDKDNDGFVTFEEDLAFRSSRRPQGNQNRPPKLPEGAVLHRDLIYDVAGERKLPLDLYLPAPSEKPVPVVIWIHGGGWKGGKKGSGGPARPLIERGYAVVDVEYRLSGEAIFPAQVNDCKAAVRWVRANAKEYNLDADHIGVWGSSAGGHLAAFLGTSGGVKEFETESHAKFSSRVQAVCDWFGPTDLLKMNVQAVQGARLDHDAPNSPESLLVGGPIQNEPYRSKAVTANPITYVTKDDPPFLIVHGDRDLLVSHRQSELLHEALKSVGVSSELSIVKNGGHGFGGGNKSREELFQQAAEFFDKHLKAK